MPMTQISPIDRLSCQDDGGCSRDALADVVVRTRPLHQPLKETLAASAMHRLCQPLTALLCTIELGMECDSAEDMRSAMRDSLRECLRAIAMVSAFRDLLQQGTRYAAEKATINARALAIAHGLRWHLPEKAGGRGTADLGLTEPQIAADPAGLDHLLRQVAKTFAACGATRQRLDGGAAPANPDILGVDAWVGASDETVKFVWRLSRLDHPAWIRECTLAQPFEPGDFDFTRNAVPRLAVARIVTEAMGGWFQCDAGGVEIRFPKLSMLRSQAQAGRSAA